ncbi:hypothetical protein FDE76_07170 [Clostridium botulinum]|uniref:Uncharacterized protein n=1 Tax=Clostridium botulinum (strain Eklund 17B / Type B) TaxID=935198 RepID=B2TIP9_CLOBB|nr:hypothetical protein [Clostridium sp. ZBS4]ACD22986.1 hypothetical protein CLL_A0312 [Clostridium botulinum B str. Eklund 17B (NRP)]MBY6977521.1 hypothetical protein [Clostridium botulinum]MBY7001774.1 hypothetical protein [Clostridium botulinum]MCR1275450.1 hypothetical protein [Clostridium botulinum]NFD70898.1 hypothetical protein [Clostridium botulinum]
MLGISTSSYIGNVSILGTFNPSSDGNTSILGMSISSYAGNTSIVGSFIPSGIQHLSTAELIISFCVILIISI